MQRLIDTYDIVSYANVRDRQDLLQSRQRLWRTMADMIRALKCMEYVYSAYRLPYTWFVPYKKRRNVIGTPNPMSALIRQSILCELCCNSSVGPSCGDSLLRP